MSHVTSDLITEYDSLLLLFRLAGEQVSRSSSVAKLSLNSVAKDPSSNSGISWGKTFAGTNISSNTASSPAAVPFYNALFTAPNSNPADAGNLLAGSSADHFIESDHNRVSFIISRAKELSLDDHLGGFQWKNQQSSILHHNQGFITYRVSDAEIVMAIFLHFCDTNLSPLVGTDDHRLYLSVFLLCDHCDMLMQI
jgi:hypothetical protein